MEIILTFNFKFFIGQSVSSVAQSCLTLGDPVDCSTPGLPGHRPLPELTPLRSRLGYLFSLYQSVSSPRASCCIFPVCSRMPAGTHPSAWHSLGAQAALNEWMSGSFYTPVRGGGPQTEQFGALPTGTNNSWWSHLRSLVFSADLFYTCKISGVIGSMSWDWRAWYKTL